jgi:drug/metabolite transporter (DMT)-like permease
MIPPFGVLWGALLLDEPLSMAHLYGGVLIAAALWLVLKPGARVALPRELADR